MAALDRRPIKSRSLAVFQRLAAWLSRTFVTPNQISVASIGFAALGILGLLVVPGWPGLVLCALGIQLRLLCNLIDGLVAVEGGKRSPVGDLYNEVPDRIADAALLVALGYATGLDWLGWLAALLAVLTAYVRVLGGALGLSQDFRGPQAKSHRMAVMTGACLIGAILTPWGWELHALTVALIVITTGSTWTCGARLSAISALLHQQARE
ncbi:CDP-alcohol phosphatidyltransferase family protein [Marinimicrobium alkaliphilum]|uniref:CDP-alcohol phosphatidyltransferase family protein n=1 Tax=Marinimicrobium alkaliphilum TaxID=2202654 RepID=UPI000DBABD9A|nr:CDP-alcohol phosphatidyltransferase family protein [Marinimicrobium alkaliphilum]